MFLNTLPDSPLLQALSSFCPPSGSVSSLNIFLSDFGKERLAEEAELGPAELRYPLLPAPYTLHPTPCTLHPTLYTLHPAPCCLIAH